MSFWGFYAIGITWLCLILIILVFLMAGHRDD